jgi:hypothetical protein
MTMSAWSEVFDDVEGQRRVRQQIAGQTAGLVLLLALAAAALLYARAVHAPPPVQAGVLAVATVGLGAVLRRLRQLRRAVWCVHVSAEAVVAYDGAGRRVALEWCEVEGVQLHAHGLTVAGPPGRSFDVPHPFPAFAALSHCLVANAEGFGVPVLVGARPWQELDVYALYPFLAEATSPDHPPATQDPA